MTKEPHHLATKFFWTFALVTFFGALAIGFYGVGIVWLMIATPFLARWHTMARKELQPGEFWAPPIRLITMFGVMFLIAVVALVAGCVTFFCICTSGVESTGPGFVGPSPATFWWSVCAGVGVIIAIVFGLSWLLTRSFVSKYERISIDEVECANENSSRDREGAGE
ncbi:hypothetical protein [Calycomorphotria hydatis]|uniref:Transmembrane protein n=1 Tax=Calycomorphotria hydatis TaxID=2528027 RepID=A0A517T4M2_9PLAN|nr:hypothetical protein [Calycomorphotria hydatis]QDT63319.1 hypothetical protein V22_05390 [Calycomorphotria hydatis]